MRKAIKTGIIPLILLTLLTTTALAQEDSIAVITDVQAPTTVEPGETVIVTITAQYSFPEQTYYLVGIYDPESWEPIIESEFEDAGDIEAEFEFEIISPDEEGDYELAADIYFEAGGEMMFTEGSEEYFTITVKKSGLGIPGFPPIALVIGLAILVLGLNSSKTKLV